MKDIKYVHIEDLRVIVILRDKTSFSETFPDIPTRDEFLAEIAGL